MGESEDAIFNVLKWADAVIFSKHFSDKAIAIAKAAKEAGCITLLDIDDLVTEFPAYSGGRSARPRCGLTEMLRLMDSVTVANTHLQDAVRPLREDCVLIPMASMWKNILSQPWKRFILRDACSPMRII